MNNEQEAYLGMCFKVKNFGIKNTAAFSPVSAVTTYFTQLGTFISQLIMADTGSRADLTGYTINKMNKRKGLELLALKVSNAISSYAVVNNDNIVLKRADFATSAWYKFTEEELVTQATIIKNLATPIAAGLTPYGAVAADVTALDTTLTAFVNMISDPTLAIDQRKIDNVKVVEVIDQIRTLFDDKLDVLMRSFEVNNPTLYALYLSARAIDINGSVHAPTVIKDVLPATTVTVHTAVAYSADTFYTIQNLGSEAVTFSLSAIDNTPGVDEVLLGAGETRSRLAENLATNGTFLVVKNSSAVTAKIRVWVE